MLLPQIKRLLIRVEKNNLWKSVLSVKSVANLFSLDSVLIYQPQSDIVPQDTLA